MNPSSSSIAANFCTFGLFVNIQNDSILLQTNAERKQKTESPREHPLAHTRNSAKLLPDCLHRANFIRQTSDWYYIAHRLFPLLPHFTHSLSPFRYVYACARGCVRFFQHTRIQRRPDSFALNHYRAILIDKIMYFAIFLYLSRDIDVEG